MGLNRMMMKNGEDLKNIKAMMTVENTSSQYGFKNGYFGSLSPNPLPNGVLVTSCYAVSNRFFVAPSSIKSCTIKILQSRIIQLTGTYFHIYNKIVAKQSL